MGAVRHGVPLDLVEGLRTQLGLTAAVETGTFRGDSAVALAGSFERVWTIELSEQLWRAAKELHRDQPRITFVQGASEDVLGQVVAGLSGPALYWLDGHYSAGVTAGEASECPVLAEIDAIDAGAHAAGSAILIDDARLFAAPPGPPHRREDWPPLMEVCDRLRQRHDRFVTVLQDAVIAVPLPARRLVEDWGTAEPTGPAPAAGAVAGLLSRGRKLVRGAQGAIADARRGPES